MFQQPLAGDEHPLLLELKTTRAALARFQEGAHAANVRLQRSSIESARTHERSVYFQQENDLLKSELSVLRSSPSTQVDSTSDGQVQDLTLALRNLSHKLTLTEKELLHKTEAWLTARAEATKARIAREDTYQLIDKVHAREQAEKLRAGELETRIQQLEQEMRMSDLTIAEYAALVRDMEARSDSRRDTNSNPIPISTLYGGKLKLQHLVDDFRLQHDNLVRERQKAWGELELAQSHVDSEKKYEQALITELTQAKAELDQLKINDDTAAKMVARYMQFSQQSTNTLLASVNTLKERHAATLTTLSSQNHVFSSQIRSLETQNDRLRGLLDELVGEVMKEKYGRRREIALRIRMGGRETRLAESLRRWVRKADETVKSVSRGDPQTESGHLDLKDSLLSLSQDARILLESLEEGGADEETALALSGARARELMIFDGIDGLLEELRVETERRVMLQALGTDEEMLAEATLTDAENEKSQSPETSGCTSTVLEAQNSETGQPLSNMGAHEDDVPSSSGLMEDNLSSTSALSRQDLSLTHQSSDMTTPLIPTTSEEMAHMEDSSDSASFSRPDEDTEGTPLVLPNLPIAPAPSLNVVDSNQPNGITLTSCEASLPEDRNATCQSSEATPSPIPCIQDHSETILVDEHASDASPSNEPSKSSPPPLRLKVQNETPQSHPLVSELAKVSKRYDHLQRAFGDCHLALDDLKTCLASSRPLPQQHPISLEVLSAAVARLDDFTEDVRVELEIKVSDEILLAKGYEALPRVPGALSSLPSTRNIEVDGPGDGANPSLSTVEQQIEAFIDGTDASVRKAKEIFAQKLEDVQHDIAILKKAVHDPQSLPEKQPGSSTSPSSKKEDLGTVKPSASWTAWIRGTSSNSPTTLTPVSGLVTNPGLPSSEADHLLGTNDEQNARKTIPSSSFLKMNTGKDVPAWDTLSALGLKIPMPNFYQPAVESYGTTNTTPISPGVGSTLSPTYPGGLGIGHPPVDSPKARTLSTMYKLGLGGGVGEGRRNTIFSGTGIFPSVSTSSFGNKPSFPLKSLELGHNGTDSEIREAEKHHDIE